MTEGCNLCPRKCGVRRDLGEIGFCQMTSQLQAARAALHMWEEPCISGCGDNAPGSGTVFFSGCTLRCIYCQNYHIAAGHFGKAISVERLGDIFLELQDKGAANINLVTPTHFTSQIIRAMDKVKHKLVIPIVHNTSGYECVETLKMLEGYIDIYLTDFKYMDSHLAAKYSMAPDYPQVAKAALAEMYRQTGVPAFFDREQNTVNRYSHRLCGLPGMMYKGVIVRHLMLPGQLLDSKKIIRYIYQTYQDHVYLCLMNQYTPLSQVADIAELNCRVKKKSYDRLVDFAINLGINKAYIQSGDTAQESFIPAFECEGI